MMVGTVSHILPSRLPAAKSPLATISTPSAPCSMGWCAATRLRRRRVRGHHRPALQHPARRPSWHTPGLTSGLEMLILRLLEAVGQLVAHFSQGPTKLEIHKSLPPSGSIAGSPNRSRRTLPATPGNRVHPLYSKSVRGAPGSCRSRDSR